MIECENVRIYEFVDKNEVERKKENKYQNKFVYVYEEAPDTLPEL